MDNIIQPYIDSGFVSKEDPDSIFKMLDVIGQGTYGSVYKACHLSTGNVVAIKIIPINANNFDASLNEIKILKEIDSVHVIKYYGTFMKRESLYLVIEYCEFGTLFDLVVSDDNILSEELIASITRMILVAFIHIHAKNIIHRDIKANNILINSRGSVKLADFGVSAKVETKIGEIGGYRYSKIGSPYWMSPEVISLNGHNQMTDIWSLGITLIEIVERGPPYNQFKPVKAMALIETSPPTGLTEPNSFSEEFNSFVKHCLVSDKTKRPTAQELLSHDFILKYAKNIQFVKEYTEKIAGGCSSSCGTDSRRESVNSNMIRINKVNKNLSNGIKDMENTDNELEFEKEGDTNMNSNFNFNMNSNKEVKIDDVDLSPFKQDPKRKVPMQAYCDDEPNMETFEKIEKDENLENGSHKLMDGYLRSDSVKSIDEQSERESINTVQVRESVNNIQEEFNRVSVNYNCEDIASDEELVPNKNKVKNVNTPLFMQLINEKELFGPGFNINSNHQNNNNKQVTRDNYKLITQCTEEVPLETPRISSIVPIQSLQPNDMLYISRHSNIKLSNKDNNIHTNEFAIKELINKSNLVELAQLLELVKRDKSNAVNYYEGTIMQIKDTMNFLRTNRIETMDNYKR